MAGRELRVVDVHDLVSMKLRAGRMQDEYDIFEIIRHVRLDQDLVERYVTAEQWATFRRIAERAEFGGEVKGRRQSSQGERSSGRPAGNEPLAIGVALLAAGQVLDEHKPPRFEALFCSGLQR